jgi:hypothetical protein
VLSLGQARQGLGPAHPLWISADFRAKNLLGLFYTIPKPKESQEASWGTPRGPPVTVSQGLP